MYCCRSAYYQKAIKATARLFENEHGLTVAFFAFGAFMIVIDIFNFLLSETLLEMSVNPELLRTNLLISFRSSYPFVSEVR